MEQTKTHKGIRRLGIDNPWYGAGGVDSGAGLSKMREILLEDTLSWEEGKVVGFKEVRHTPGHFVDYGEFFDYLCWLDKLLPGVRIIFNVRDVKDCIKSGWWADTPDAESIVSESREWILRAAPEFEKRFPNRALLMDYDTWNGNVYELARVLDFAGCERDVALLQRVSCRALEHGRSG